MTTTPTTATSTTTTHDNNLFYTSTHLFILLVFHSNGVFLVFILKHVKSHLLYERCYNKKNKQ